MVKIQYLIPPTFKVTMSDTKNNLELDFGTRSKGMLPSKSTASIHEFYLSGTIEEPDTYIDWFDTIRHARASDTIKIYINSCGGDLYTAIQFMRVLYDTEATITCSVEGACMSAATMIFMCADEYEVTPHSTFMFHNYSGGTFGKGGEMIDQLQHERKWSAKLMTDIYKDFLTEAEITSILDSRDIWMDGEEVVLRMTIRSEALEAEMMAEMEAMRKAEKKNKG